MAPTQGILYVTMQPDPSLPLAQFHDWYNNEHGPNRLRLSFIENGFRYVATDLDGAGRGMPEWLAVYNVVDIHELTKEPYTALRNENVTSQREKDTMRKIAVDRRIYETMATRYVDRFRLVEDKYSPGAGGSVLVAVSITTFPGKEDELRRWYDEEHIDLLSKVPGWLRTRCFVTASVDGPKKTEYLALHEYAAHNGLGGEEFQAAIRTPWYEDVMASVVKEKRSRTYQLFYAFGPAPRHLASISDFISPDGRTRTFAPSPGTDGGSIESYVTTQDGVDLPYRLEGSSNPNAPLIVLSNSILVDWGIWDGFLAAFFSSPENRIYRVLRYLTRGRSHACGTRTITLDILSSDLITLLDALQIPRAAAAIGVSLGGATVLNAAVKYPARLAAFVSCDTNSKSPAGNRKAWGERIAVAEKDGMKSEHGEAIVGQELAELTVRRWFVKESYDSGKQQAEVERVKAMVAKNSLEGFKKSVNALFDYDVSTESKSCAVKGAFVVGSGDGILPGTMKEIAAAYGNGIAEYKVIEGAGHLPMVEKPEQFAAFVTKFLGQDTP